jgi:hypothetical protein
MSWIITGSFAQPDEPEALAYIAAVEAADGQTLEDGVKFAYNSFIKGCKADGIWDAIKASCILAGARTLDGALVPLVGTAPTNYNFVSGDYNRETGLVGDGSTKYLDSNRNNNVDPQNNRHASVFIGEANTNLVYSRYIAAGDSSQGDTGIGGGSSPGDLGIRFYCMSSSFKFSPVIADSITGFLGVSRDTASEFNSRGDGLDQSFSFTSRTPRDENYRLFGRPEDSQPRYVNARLAFYSIGESLDLALLDTRVTTLVSDLAAAIP